MINLTAIDPTPIFLTLFIVVYWLYVFVIIYHLIRFGIGPEPKLLAFIFFLGSIVVVLTTLFFYSRADLAGLLTTLGKSYRPSLPF